MTKMQRLTAALREKQQMDTIITDMLKEMWPVGSSIMWVNVSGTLHNHAHHNGTVLGHGHGRRVLVENDETKKRYWIHAWRIAG